MVAQVEQVVQDLAAEHLKHALPQRRHRRNVQQFDRVVPQHKALCRMRQAVVRHQRRDVRDLGLVRPQEFLARRNVVEQIPNRDGRAPGQGRFIAAQELAACDLDRGADLILGAAFPAASAKPRRWKASASPRNPSVAIESRSLTSASLLVACRSNASSASSRSMPLPLSARRIRRRPPAFDIQPEVGRARVERVLQQLFDDASRAFHHLSCRDFIRDGIGENPDTPHVELL